MTPDQQRIAIAEYCGWAVDKDGYWKDANKVYAAFGLPPNYLNDLNAMHEAEEVILKDADDGYSYDCELNTVCGCWDDGVMNYMKLWHATAAQRAEAFLRAVGKWKE